MRDAATAAAMSDPENNRWFRRRWTDDDIGVGPTRALVGSAAGRATLTPDEELDLLGHDLLQQWRRERTSKETAP